MKKNYLVIFALIALVFALSSCVTRLGAFTVISTHNIDWSRAGEYKRGKRAEGNDTLHIIIFIPTKMNVDIEEAVDSALMSVPGAVALIDAVIRYKSFYFPYLYGQQSFIVEGTILYDPKLVADNGREASSEYMLVKPSKEGRFETTSITEQEYAKYAVAENKHPDRNN